MATNIAAAIFPIHFALVVAELSNAGLINTIYGYAVSFGNLLVPVLSPFLGSIGDFRGMKLHA